MKASRLLQAAACVEILSQEIHAELSATFADSPTLRDLSSASPRRKASMRRASSSSTATG
jgi:hypothetical protein